MTPPQMASASGSTIARPADRPAARESAGAPVVGLPSSQPVRRVVLVDPREERRAIMGMLIELCPTLTVVGLAGTLEEASAQIRSEQADVALVEIQMPVAQGLSTVGALRQQFPALRIVVCSFHASPGTRQAAREYGADGYLPKPLDIRELLSLLEDPPPASS